MTTVSTGPSTIPHVPHKMSTWKLDPVHSRIEFSVRYLMIGRIKGCFNKYDGLVDWDEEDLTLSSVAVHIDTSSVFTGDDGRDENLRSAMFLHADDHPELSFKSTRIERVSDKEYSIYGDLTFHGVTQEVKLDTIYGGRAVHPITGDVVAGFEAHTIIDRKEFGVSTNIPLNTGDLAIGDDVKVEINAQFTRLGEPEAGS